MKDTCDMRKSKIDIGMSFRKINLVLGLFLVSLTAIGCDKDNKKWDTVFPPDTDSIPEQYDIPFDAVPVTADIIMYEVNPRAFSASGDLTGITESIDSIQKLGINVIWIMPIYTSGELNSVGSPYAVRNYSQVNPDFGDLEDLRLLVKEAHERDMAVILDWVANHTSWDNEWIKNKSWYTQDAGGNIIQPPGTNWQDVADLNYSNSDMRHEMIKCMKYWVLEANVDGYRCDYADGVPLDFWKQAIDTLVKIPDRELIMFAEGSKKELLSSGFQMIFGWNFYGKLLEVFNDSHSASEMYTVNTSDYSGLPLNTHILRWISNHDQNAWEDTPIAAFQGQEGSLAAFVLASYMGGVPLIYNGQEVGCPVKLSFFKNNITKINWNINPEIKEVYRKLIAIRKNSEAIRSGSLTSYNHNDVVVFKRIKNGEEVLVMVNVRNVAITYPLPVELQNTGWKDGLSGADIALENSLNLAPFEYKILKK